MNRPSSSKILHCEILFNFLIAQNAIGVIDIFLQFEIRTTTDSKVATQI